MKKITSFILMILCAFICSACDIKTSDMSSQLTAEPIALNTITPAECFSGGDGSKENPYQITTAEQLALLSKLLECGNYSTGYEYGDKSYIMTNDIYLNDTSNWCLWIENAPEYTWIPIYEFKGNFDGAGHTVYGLYIDDNSTNLSCGYAGLFSSLSNGSICNLNLAESVIKIDSQSCSYVGSIVGNIYNSTIERCSSSAAIHSYKANNIGGIAGWAYKSAIKDCCFSGKIQITASSLTHMGGIVGSIGGDLINCVNYGVLNCDSSCAGFGGVAGTISSGDNGIISGCVNYADIDVPICVGGVIGNLWITPEILQENSYAKLLIENCKNEGTIRCSSREQEASGGIIATIRDNSGLIDSLVIRNCNNSGAIYTEEQVGGIIGLIDAPRTPICIENCENSGNIYAERIAGGLIGDINRPNQTLQVSCSNNYGDIQAENANVGGIIGRFFDFSLDAEEDLCSEVYIEHCVNYGVIFSENGFGSAGIIGKYQNSIYPPTLFDISYCFNLGKIYAYESGRIGGIVGDCGVVQLQNECCLFLNHCGNYGEICLGDGLHTLFDLEVGDEERTIEERAVMILGGPCIGGIIGLSDSQVSMDTCVNAGIIRVPSTITLQNIFAGAIVGQYRCAQTESEGNIREGMIIFNCLFAEDTAPFAGTMDIASKQEKVALLVTDGANAVIREDAIAALDMWMATS